MDRFNARIRVAHWEGLKVPGVLVALSALVSRFLGDAMASSKEVWASGCENLAHWLGKGGGGLWVLPHRNWCAK